MPTLCPHLSLAEGSNLALNPKITVGLPGLSCAIGLLDVAAVQAALLLCVRATRGIHFILGLFVEGEVSMMMYERNDEAH